jgi:molybdate transport system substrate-binding protein
MQGRAQAGVTWQSEAIFQEQIGNAITHVDIPSAQNTTAIYAGVEVKGAAHAQAARLWLSFVCSPTALDLRALRVQAVHHSCAGKLIV